MKNRLLWVAVVLAACAGYYFVMIKPALEPALPSVTIEALKKLRPPPQLPPPELPLPVITEPVIPPLTPKPAPLPVVRPDGAMTSKPVVPIQDGVTIDFSYGAPHIKPQGKDAEALEKALKEMAEATKDVTFPPTKK